MKTDLNNKIIFILLLLVIPLFNLTFIPDPSLTSKYLFLSVVLVFAALIIFINNKELQIKITNFHILLIIYVFYTILSLIKSNNKGDGLYEFSKLILFCFLLFYFNIQKISINKEFILTLFLLLIFISNLYGILEFFNLYNHINLEHSNLYQITSFFAHKNIYSEIVLLLLPFQFYSFFYSVHYKKYLSLFNLISSLILIILLMTRAVWLAFMASFIIVLIMLLLNNSIIRKKKRNILITILVLLFTCSILFLNTTRKNAILKKQIQSIFIFNYGSTGDRIELWKKSIDLFKENPVFGIGLSDWKIEILHFGNQKILSEDNLTFYQRPHNDYIWILCEQGIIGFTLYLALLLIIFYYLFKIIIKAKEQKEIIWSLTLLFSFTSYLIFSFFSFPKERIEHLILFAILIAFIIEEFINIKSSFTIIHIKKIKLVLFINLILIICTVYIALFRIKSEYFYIKAMKYRSILDYKRTILNIKKSENIFYNIDPFCTPLSWYSGNAYFMLDNQNEALQDYKRAFEINPNHIHVLNNYGTSLNIIGNSKESIVLFEKALKIAPNFEDALLNLVAIYYNENQVDKAYDLFNKYNEISSNNRFYEILNFVFKDKISIFANSCKNDYLKKQLFDISNNPDWIKSIYIKSRKNIFSFKKQLFLDAIYMLENYNKDITKDEIKIIKQNFNTP